MDDLLPNKEDPAIALELARLLEDHRCGDVLVLDMRPLHFWTDYFIIATVSSSTHLVGLERYIKDFIRDNDLDILGRSRRPEKSDEWRLVDLGTMVIHLMTAKSRSFYELERLWNAAPVIWPHSSKSS